VSEERERERGLKKGRKTANPLEKNNKFAKRFTLAEYLHSYERGSHLLVRIAHTTRSSLDSTNRENGLQRKVTFALAHSTLHVE